jgi:hypothetical protein
MEWEHHPEYFYFFWVEFGASLRVGCFARLSGGYINNIIIIINLLLFFIIIIIYTSQLMFLAGHRSRRIWVKIPCLG